MSTAEDNRFYREKPSARVEAAQAAADRFVAAGPELLDAAADATGVLRAIAKQLRADRPATAALLTAAAERLLAAITKAVQP